MGRLGSLLKTSDVRTRAGRIALVALVLVVLGGAGMGLGLTSSSQLAGAGHVVPPEPHVATARSHDPRASELDGVDVSAYQGTIDWTTVYGDGITFAFAKAAEGNEAGCDDADWVNNAVNGKAAGVYIGAYDFAEMPSGSEQACSSGSGADNATAEANTFDAEAGPYFTSGYMYPALDLEQGCAAEGDGSLTATEMSHWVGMWMSTVESYISTNDGYTIVPTIYMSASYAESCIDQWITQFPLWVANWDVSSPGTGLYSTWAYWQYNDDCTTCGVAGDADYFNGDLSALTSGYVFGSAGPTPPTVTYAMQDVTTGSALTCGDTFAAGNTIQFTSTVTGGTSPYTYAWYFGYGGTSTAANPTYVYTQAGTVTPLLNVTDAAGKTGSTGTGCTFTVTGSVPLAITASGTPTSGTAPLTVAFTSTPSGGTGTYSSYAWTFGGGGTGTGQNPSYTYTAAGTYSASVVVTDSGGATATSNTVTITVSNPPLTISAGGTPTSGTAPLTVAFTSTPSGGTGSYPSYVWAFGDGSPAGSGQNPSHTYTSAGTYSATVTVTDSSGASATSSAVTIAVSPGTSTLTITASANRSSSTVGMPVSFSSTPSGGTAPYTYAWAFDDGQTSTSENPVHAYLVAGTYTATVTVTDSAGHSATSSGLTITVSSVPGPLAVAATVDPTSGSTTTSFAFVASATGGSEVYSSYAWTFGDGTTGSGAAPTHTYSAAGTYSVTVTVTDSTGATATSAAVTVTVTASGSGAQPLKVSLGASTPNGTVGTQVSFLVQVSGGTQPYTFDWSGLPQGCSAVDEGSLPCTPSASGDYLVQVTVSDSGSPPQQQTEYLHFNVTASTAGSGTTPQGSTILGLPLLWVELAVLIAGIAAVGAVVAVAVHRRGKTPPEAQGGYPNEWSAGGAPVAPGSTDAWGADGGGYVPPGPPPG